MRLAALVGERHVDRGAEPQQVGGGRVAAEQPLAPIGDREPQPSDRLVRNASGQRVAGVALA